MGRTAYKVWSWTYEKAKKIAWPCEGGSGAGPALANTTNCWRLNPSFARAATPKNGSAGQIMKGKRIMFMKVFMLVGLPDPKRDPKYHKPGMMLRIREAIVELTQVVLTNGHTLMAIDHPAISPLLMRVAGWEAHGGRGILSLHQIHHPDPDQAFASRKDADYCLRSCDMAILIAGMEDEAAQWEIAKAAGAKMLPVASTGALAAELYDKGEGPTEPTLRKALKSELIYQFLFETILGIQYADKD